MTSISHRRRLASLYVRHGPKEEIVNDFSSADAILNHSNFTSVQTWMIKEIAKYEISKMKHISLDTLSNMYEDYWNLYKRKLFKAKNQYYVKPSRKGQHDYFQTELFCSTESMEKRKLIKLFITKGKHRMLKSFDYSLNLPKEIIQEIA